MRRDTEAILQDVAARMGVLDQFWKGRRINGFKFNCDRARALVNGIKWYEDRRRPLETEAWYRDGYQKRVLAARRRLMRVVVLLILRRVATQRAVALYWQERTQRALCAPGGAGRAADKGAFESEFA